MNIIILPRAMWFRVVLTIAILKFRSSTADYCLEKIDKAEEVSEKCSDQLKILCDRHDLVLTLWDASSRILHTGLTSSGNKDLGDYDLCTSIDSNEGKVNILGKYCLYEWVSVINRTALQEFVAMGELMQSNLIDRVHSVQNEQLVKADSIQILGSICIPDACTPQEFVRVFNPYLYPVMHRENRECVTKYTKRELSTFDIVTLTCFGIIIATGVVCTTYHVALYYTGRCQPSELVLAFSLFHNGKKLFAKSINKTDQIRSMNGMRFLSMIWIIEGHGISSLVSLNFTNQRVAEEFPSRLYSQYIQGAHMAVDTFFFLSGFLLAFGYLKQAKNSRAMEQIKSVPLMYLHRYLRLTPALAAMFFFTLTGFRLLGSGPLWSATIDICSMKCRQYWWRFFLYIQNYTPTDFCWTQTWYLSADMQMFFLAPIVLIPTALLYQRHMRKVILGLASLAAFCVGISIAVPYIVEDYDNDYDTHSRLSGYLVGIIGGIIFFRNRGKHIKIYRVINLGLWIISLAVMLFIVLYMNDVTENGTKLKKALFFPLCRPIWCLCIMWITFSCYFGSGGIINTFLSNDMFQIGARLTYSMYIVHGLVEVYVIGRIRTIQYFDDFVNFYFTCGNVVASIIVAIFWTLLFESPIIGLDKLLFRWIGSLHGKASEERIT